MHSSTTTVLSSLILIGALSSSPVFAQDAQIPAEPGAVPTATAGLVAQPAPTANLFHQEGIASWYGAEFEGRLTASGERFDSRLLTAAHPTLPFGTMLKITNTQNGKSVVVRVNDRGPFVAARILDVSRGAAEVLDMIVTGTAPITVESLEPVKLAAAAVETAVPAATTDTAVAAPETEPAITTPADPALVTDPAAAEAPGTAVPAAVEAPVAPAAPAAAPTKPESIVVATPVATVTVTSKPESAASAAAAKPASRPATVLPRLPDPANGKFYRLQVGSYRLERNAAEAFDKLAKAGLSPAYERNGALFRVVLVRIPSAEIQNEALLLGSLGFREVLAREEAK